MEHPIAKAARIVGSQRALAAALGVTKGAVWQWKEDDRQVPAEHCPHIERLTSGNVRCEDLRPDVDWGYLRKSGTEPVALPAAEVPHA
ncbi:helix-turn-helix domain-containing protein [Paracidovorax oryzae]|uniref:helix-turn-helix domain-containing protein n=1 Tax=Paracidovorax oryzae TaxID=862720 RepID=UPI0009DA752B|nr:helix-turn-helix domain-containing protein [Paracidovorax oryzae]